MDRRIVPKLERRHVYVWAFRASASNELISQFKPVLTSDETIRAARIRPSNQRESFVLTRGVLRHLLSHYLDLDPVGIRFEYRSNGKPAFASGADIEFNVTHSSGLSAIALTVGCDIGIDVEELRPIPDLEQIATRFFCPEETEEIKSLEPTERNRAFLAQWTRKEAYIKATGAGLSKALNSFRAAYNPVSPRNPLLLEDDRDASETWTLADLFLSPDYVGAIAYRDRQRPLSILPIADLSGLISEDETNSKGRDE